MTNPANNPPNPKPTPAEPSRAMRNTRLLIAVVLFAGIAVFAVITIEELKAGPPNSRPPTDFGAADPNRDNASAAGNAPLAGLTGTDPAKFPLIDRPNPHPGEIKPFGGTAPRGLPPYRQAGAGEVWEFCVYELPDASMNELITYYASEARRRGLKQIKLKPTDNTPGGIEAAWGDGKNRL
ncbi:MAG: hypothetical protein KTR15_15585, partial [Phycisphaeraceae bacterium]|nr:hypothetical protein [Phycisphaeraceae bacterium]